MQELPRKIGHIHHFVNLWNKNGTSWNGITWTTKTKLQLGIWNKVFLWRPLTRHCVFISLLRGFVRQCLTYNNQFIQKIPPKTNLFWVVCVKCNFASAVPINVWRTGSVCGPQAAPVFCVPPYADRALSNRFFSQPF